MTISDQMTPSLLRRDGCLFRCFGAGLGSSLWSSRIGQARGGRSARGWSFRYQLVRYDLRGGVIVHAETLVMSPLRGSIKAVVLTILFAALVALFLLAALSPSPKAHVKSAWQRCQINLKQIGLAKTMWASDTSTNGSPGWHDLRPYLLRLGFTNGQPVCPEGGSYSIGALNEAPHCSLGKPHALP